MFKDAIRAAVAYKDDSTDFMDEIMRELEVSNVEERFTSIKIDKTKILMINRSLMKVESIAECSPCPRTKVWKFLTSCTCPK